MGLFCFDFSGSGLSEGEYITLGINESHDLECVVNYLVSLGKVSNIALWGRRYFVWLIIFFFAGIIFLNSFNSVRFLLFDSYLNGTIS